MCTLGILDFDEKPTFNFFASNGQIKRELSNPKLSNPHARAARARRIEKIYGNLQKPRARRAHYAIISFLPSVQYV